MEKEKQESQKKGKLVKLNIEDLIKAHPLIKGVLSHFHKYVEGAEPNKADRPKARIIVSDTITTGFQGIMKTSKDDPNETCRLITVSLEVEKNKFNKLLIKQSAKAHPNLGTFYENDFEADRDVAMFVEGLVGHVISELAVVGLVTATSNAFYEQQY